MAYNPFDFFRRNQKTFFAVLTAFVMVMFVLSFGQGDFFQWLPRWLGSKRGQGDVVATVDGRKLHASELDHLRGGRVLANQFMLASTGAAAHNIAQAIGDQLPQASDTGKGIISRILQEHQQLAQFGYNPIAFQLGIYGQSGQMLGILLNNPQAKNEDKDLAKAAQNLIMLDTTRALGGQAGYFYNLPLTDREKDVFEFDLWLRKADKLGITFSGEDAKQMYLDEFFNRVRNEDVAEIEKGFRDRQGYNRDRLWEALANEFAVRAAQEAVLGPGVGRNGGAIQAFTAPYEAYQFYKDQVVAGNYALMAVPAENFLDQVQGKPTETEVRELFQKYRDKEPNPALETPGFKEPRKLKIGWLEMTGTEPFYAKAGAEALKAAEAEAKAAFLTTAPDGLAAWNQVAALAVANLQDPALLAQYEASKTAFRVQLDNAWFPSFGMFFRFDVLPTSVVQPANLAAAAGAAAGSLLTHGSPFTAPAVFESWVRSADWRARAKVMAPLLASPLAPATLLGNALVAGVRLPDPLPLPVVRDQLAEQVRKEVARKVVEADVNRFMDEMAKLAAKRDKSEARAYLDKFVAERGLKTGVSQGFRDFYTIEEDPGLKPLLDKKERGHAMSDVPVPFGTPFFTERDPSNPRQVSLAKSFYTPKVYPEPDTPFTLREGEPSFLFWRTEEVAAETPKDIEKVRPKIEAVWRRMKARELAKQSAEDLAKQVRERLAKEPGGDQAGVIDQVVRDVHAQYAAKTLSPDKAAKASYFLIPNVAPFPDTPVSTAIGMRNAYEPFQLKPSKTLKYPTQAMAEALLKGKDEKLGTVQVLVDNPKDTNYVAVLQNRNDRSSLTFTEDVYRQTGFPSQLAEAIRGREREEAIRHAREQALALLKTEFNVKDVNEKRLADKAGSGDTGE